MINPTELYMGRNGCSQDGYFRVPYRFSSLFRSVIPSDLTHVIVVFHLIVVIFVEQQIISR